MNNTPRDSFGFLIHDVGRLMRGQFDREAKDTGLTRAQWFVLAHLKRSDGARQHELARIMDISAMTLARHVDRLEGEGWVERRDDPDDRRAKRLFLTDRARPMLQSLQKLGQKLTRRALKGISNEEQAIAQSVLRRIRDNLTILDAVSDE
ncbi:MAG: MarR family transcriptional regulator [Pseudomonadales bacterium]|nr:MarR family transcriptional regulator [Pseudomonadales bacterium]